MTGSKTDGTRKVEHLVGCKCTLAQRLTGDGCSICNPSLAEDYAGKPNGEKCPVCGLGIMADAFGNKWCPDAECDYDY